MASQDSTIRTEADSGVHWQRFAVPFSYPIHFTERLFAPDNPVLVEALSHLEPGRHYRCLVFLDDGLLAQDEELRICVLLEHLGFRLWHPALEKRRGDGELEVLRGLADFREHLGGELTITLLGGIGRGIEVHEMDVTLVRQSIAWLKDREQA